jgi:hypothetical protein
LSSRFTRQRRPKNRLSVNDKLRKILPAIGLGAAAAAGVGVVVGAEVLGGVGALVIGGIMFSPLGAIALGGLAGGVLMSGLVYYVLRVMKNKDENILKILESFTKI